MGTEDPSLTVLFGDDVYQDIQAVAAETGLPVSAVESAVRTFAPQLLGADSGVMAREIPVPEEEPKFGDKFANIFGTIVREGSAAAPQIAAAFGKGQPSTGTTSKTAFDPMSLLIPGAIAAAILFLIMKK